MHLMRPRQVVTPAYCTGLHCFHQLCVAQRTLHLRRKTPPDIPCRPNNFSRAERKLGRPFSCNELSQLVDALHYFPFGEVWFEERPSGGPA